ncbi:hypothetical protein P152DRAFT_299090 [Eremomyces bilateralis CBS 781.70]|uniref:Uncharacterized protein n=1 Tax=Eremomyces bilateralis CBS 781.70 TaxID=1392243 RepID=A0A6G1G7C4_9PEZI|nr:uncharacterized protein P152DRAFT_299090 [Eremomyces bilateralis CBS 781.70]KAF1813953.1 hypothetical protein P152DRAFT_299090 [Eremomyces bilateralis CBS 781.70]
MHMFKSFVDLELDGLIGTATTPSVSVLKSRILRRRIMRCGLCGPDQMETTSSGTHEDGCGRDGSYLVVASSRIPSSRNFQASITLPSTISSPKHDLPIANPNRRPSRCFCLLPITGLIPPPNEYLGASLKTVGLARLLGELAEQLIFWHGMNWNSSLYRSCQDRRFPYTTMSTRPSHVCNIMELI